MLAALGAVICLAMVAAIMADDPDAAIQLAVLYVAIAVWTTWGFSLFGAVDKLLELGGFTL